MKQINKRKEFQIEQNEEEEEDETENMWMAVTQNKIL